MTLIVYLITNKINGKVYVGKTERTLELRWRDHLNDSIKRPNRSPFLYNAMNKHGVENFSIQKIASAETRQELDALEKLWIVKLHSMDAALGYNLTSGGTGGKLAPASLAKMAENQKKRLSSPEACAKCATRKGLKLSEETRSKMSVSQRGRKHSDATRAKMSAYHKQLGPEAMIHLYTPEMNASRSKKLMGRIVSDETRQKLKLAQAARKRKNSVTSS